MQREPRTAEYLIRHNVQDFACEGLELINVEMMHLAESARRERDHVRDHGECSHGCCDTARITHHRNGELICRWTRESCPQQKQPSAGVADVLAEFSDMGDGDNGDSDDSDESGTE